MATIINPGTSPVVYSEEGHMIDAGGRRTDVTLDACGQAAVDAGNLIVESDPASSGDDTDTSADTPSEPSSARRPRKP